MSQDQRLARVKVTKELLIISLHLPIDVEIINIRIDDDPRNIEMVVRHPDLPIVETGNAIPLANPKFVRQEVYMQSWGVE